MLGSSQQVSAAASNSAPPAVEAVLEEGNSALMESAVEVFDTMLGWPVVKTPEVVPSDKAQISAIVAFFGRMKGFVALHMDQDIAVSIACGLLGLEPDDCDEEVVRDAVGEIGNMVTGGLKNKLNSSVEAFSLGIPSVVEGQSISTRGPRGSACSLTGLLSDERRFCMQLVVQE